MKRPKYTVDENGCWVWNGAKDKDGYGLTEGKRAHRHYFEIHNGPIRPGMELDHKCRNRSCVRPDHLEEVSKTENLQRAWAWKRGQVKRDYADWLARNKTKA